MGVEDLKQMLSDELFPELEGELDDELNLEDGEDGDEKGASQKSSEKASSEGKGGGEGEDEGKGDKSGGEEAGKEKAEEKAKGEGEEGGKAGDKDAGDKSGAEAGSIEEDAPKTWRPNAAAEWGKLPPVVQAEIMKRENDMFRGLETYRQDAQIGKSLKEVVNPYMEDLRKEGIEPLYLINNLLTAHVTLSRKTNPEQKVAIFQKLAEMYEVPLDPDSLPYVDPQVAAMQKELANLRSKIDSNDNRVVEEIKATNKRELDAFIADPAHPHFDLVADDMAMLIRAGRADDLKSAYEQAIYLNPTARALELQRQTGETEARLRREAEEKVRKAEAANAANLRVSPRSVSDTAPLGTMEDTLNATFSKIKSRG